MNHYEWHKCSILNNLKNNLKKKFKLNSSISSWPNRSVNHKNNNHHYCYFTFQTSGEWKWFIFEWVLKQQALQVKIWGPHCTHRINAGSLQRMHIASGGRQVSPTKADTSCIRMAVQLFSDERFLNSCSDTRFCVVDSDKLTKQSP
jgi:hypothetical protein